jgi:hypothetical protein
MKVQIILTQNESNLFTIRQQRIQEMQLGLNKIQEDFNRINQDLQLEKVTQDQVWKSIYRGWQMEKPEERLVLTFPETLEIKFENGSVICEIPDLPKVK